jgi:hypothetical protein
MGFLHCKTPSVKFQADGFRGNASYLAFWVLTNSTLRR